GFFVDLGAIFDLGTLRPFQQFHVVGRQLFKDEGKPVNTLNRTNVHSIAIQVPLSSCRRGGKKYYRGRDRESVIGVWTSASRQQVRVREDQRADEYAGPHVQVSRLGNPLFNEVIVPMSRKDLFNSQPPADDKNFAEFVAKPELATLLPTLYPDVFPNLEKLVQAGTPRADLLAILLTGIPDGIIDGFQNNTGDVQSDMLRLNTAVPPAKDPKQFGLLDGDIAGFPNGRRVTDDVVSIALRAVAGATFALIDKNFTPDEAAAAVTPGLSVKNVESEFLDHFPYLGLPYDGFTNPS
ncbi:MAG TPA: DUF4331 domain-containing protein, partial [Catenuloplanes sp.]